MASGSSSSAGRRRSKGKIRWSKLYSYSCFRADINSTIGTGGGDNVSGPVLDHQLLGQPGFSRVVFCNEPHLHKVKPFKYPKNYVSTTKYNVVTFIPKALFEQFRRVANLYFLLAAVLSITSLAPFSPVSLIAPLVFVVGVSMIKEAVEDWHRFLQVIINILIHLIHFFFFFLQNLYFFNPRCCILFISDVKLPWCAIKKIIVILILSLELTSYTSYYV